VSRLAREKAGVVSRASPDSWVIGADTTVVVDGRILGKPADTADARRMLRRLSGRAHHVVSAVALAHEERGVLRSAVSSTRVFFRKLTSQDVEWYAGTGEPMGKAGGYAIQGLGGALVSRIEGSFSNVVGFPLETFLALWKEASLPLPWARRRPR